MTVYDAALNDLADRIRKLSTRALVGVVLGMLRGPAA
jgi:hypothetical protein